MIMESHLNTIQPRTKNQNDKINSENIEKSKENRFSQSNKKLDKEQTTIVKKNNFSTSQSVDKEKRKQKITFENDSKTQKVINSAIKQQYSWNFGIIKIQPTFCFLSKFERDNLREDLLEMDKCLNLTHVSILFGTPHFNKKQSFFGKIKSKFNFQWEKRSFQNEFLDAFSRKESKIKLKHKIIKFSHDSVN